MAANSAPRIATGDGKVVTPVGLGADFGYSAAVQADGRIVLGGYIVNGSSYDVALVRYNADGSLDQGFGTGGKVVTPVNASIDVGFSVALQPDGRILLGGYGQGSDPYSDFALLRYNSDGSLDATFDGDGRVTTALGATAGDIGYSVALQPDGKIVLGGTAGGALNPDFALVRYNADGSLDTTFGTGGKVVTPVGPAGDLGYSLALQPDGKILLGGTSVDGVVGGDFSLVRYNIDGSLDAGFGTGGRVLTPVSAGGDIAYSVSLQPDGRIVLAGAGNGDFAIVRYNADGSLDDTFGRTSFTRGGPPVVLDAELSIYDAELAAQGSYGSATLTLSRAGAANGGDVFGASGTLGALTKGGALVVGGVSIGTVLKNGGGELALSFGAGASQALVDAALRQITYANAAAAPPASVKLEWLLSDGNGGMQGGGGAKTARGTTTVAITGGGNKAPVLAKPIADQKVAEDQLWSFKLPVGTFTDADGDALAVSARLAGGAALPGWLAFDAASRIFSGRPPKDLDGDLAIKVTASDGKLSASDTFRLDVNPINDAPVIISGGGAASAAFNLAENKAVVAVLRASDADRDTLTWSIVGGADAKLLAINPKTGVLAFTTAPDFEMPADAGGNNVYDVKVGVSDGRLADTQTVSVQILDVSGITRTGKGSRPEKFSGTPEEDIFFGKGGRDTLIGNGGNDLLAGGRDRDRLIGGLGRDTASYEDAAGKVTASLALRKGLRGEASGDLFFSIENLTGSRFGDVLTGSSGKNVISGGRGNDRIKGAAGDDLLIGGAGRDTLVGGTGSDTASYVNSRQAVVISVSSQRGRGGDAQGDKLSSIENLVGSRGNDRLSGDGRANVIEGGRGNDALRGGGGDTLRGGLGRNMLEGNGGADAFVFDVKPSAAAGIDEIADFIHGVDSLRLDRGAFEGLSQSKLAASAFHLGTRAARGDDRILYDKGTGYLYFDADGTGIRHAPVKFAQVKADITIDYTVFLVV